MPLLIHCPSCKKPLKVREELAGKKVKCPACGKPVPVQVEEPASEEEVEAAPAPAKKVTAAPPPKKAAKAPPPPVDEDEEEEEERDEEQEEEEEEVEEKVTTAKPKKKGADAPAKGKKGDASKGGKQWKDCPKCGASDPKRVKFTWWGSIYGPRMFSHVRCQECGHKYNGLSGGSNIVPAIGCTLIFGGGIIFLLGVIAVLLYFLVQAFRG